MAKDLFSVPIFFIVFRETLEAAIIISVLLGLVEQLVYHIKPVPDTPSDDSSSKNSGSDGQPKQDALPAGESTEASKRRLIRKLRIQIFLGAGLGLLIALSIGAAFIAVWFTQASNLWSKSEEIWEGIFDLIAAIMIFVMGITMLKVDRAKTKWRVKLQRAFEGKHVDGGTQTGKWSLFVLPFITVLREGLEAVIFVGGVSLGQSATAIPIAAIVGIICGLICGFLIYYFASRSTLTIFLIVMTNFLLLIGAGLFSRTVAAFEMRAFNKLLGTSVDDAGGDGPGSFDVRGSIWHLDCCNPNNNLDGHGWLIFKGLFGWNNNGTVGTVLAYIFYWLAVIVTLVIMKFREGRTKLFGKESSAGERRRRIREGTNDTSNGDEKKDPVNAEEVPVQDVLPR